MKMRRIIVSLVLTAAGMTVAGCEDPHVDECHAKGGTIVKVGDENHCIVDGKIVSVWE